MTITTSPAKTGIPDILATNAITPEGGTLAVSGAVSTNGQIVFPATANLAAGANTLDDYQEGSFLATATGMTTSPTGTFTYTICGNQVVMNLVAISGVSNAATFTLTGMPVEARPITAQRAIVRCQDNAVMAYGHIEIGTAGTITVHKNAAEAGWTASGTKSIEKCSVSYTLV